VALGGGALPYFARPVDPVAIHWLGAAGCSTLARELHAARVWGFAHVLLPAWLRGAASDAAYAFAVGALVARAPRPVLAAGALFAVAHELAQGLGLVDGTFDSIDLVVLVGFFALGAFVLWPRELVPLAAHPSVNPHVLESP
jgi:hypothetical protein